MALGRSSRRLDHLDQQRLPGRHVEGVHDAPGTRSARRSARRCRCPARPRTRPTPARPTGASESTCVTTRTVWRFQRSTSTPASGPRKNVGASAGEADDAEQPRRVRARRAGRRASRSPAGSSRCRPATRPGRRRTAGSCGRRTPGPSPAGGTRVPEPVSPSPCPPAPSARPRAGLQYRPHSPRRVQHGASLMPHRETRRTFLKHSTAAGVALGLAGPTSAGARRHEALHLRDLRDAVRRRPRRSRTAARSAWTSGSTSATAGRSGPPSTTTGRRTRTCSPRRSRTCTRSCPQPKAGIGQRAFLVRTKEGNVLFDCVPPLDDATVAAVKKLGGLAAVAVSHPHYYTTMVEWSHAFGKVPVHIHKLDAKWVMRPGRRW